MGHLLRRTLNQIDHSQKASLHAKRGERCSLLSNQLCAHVVTVAADLVRRHACGEKHLIELGSQQIHHEFLSSIKIDEVWDTPKWRTVDRTSDPISNRFVQSQVRLQTHASHAMSKQKEGQVGANLLKQ